MQVNTSPENANGRLVAVVVTYNRLEQLKTTVARLLSAAPRDLMHLLVVDNASSDGTAAWLAEQTDERLVVRRSEANIGGAGGFELGMRVAMAEWSPDWVLLMDDDARPYPDALRRFHAEDRSGYEAWSAAAYHPDGRICDMNRPWINPFWHKRAFFRTAFGGGRDGFHLNAADYAADAPLPIDGASFVGLFLSRRAVTLAGYPDGALFIYGDDVLYTLLLSKSGGRIAFDPALRFEHDFTTFEGAKQRFRPLWKCYYHHRNLLMVYRRAAGWLFYPILLVVLPKWALKIRDHKGEKMAFAKLMLRAVRDGLRRKRDVSHDVVVGWSKR